LRSRLWLKKGGPSSCSSRHHQHNTQSG
jgi:hypothetical protein